MGIRWEDDEHFEILGPWDWRKPLSTRTIAILAFLVGFALCYLIFVP